MLKIYAINLNRRADRWNSMQENLLSQGIHPSLVQRIPAIEDKDFGALGCAKSHVFALSHFLTHESHPYCLILEDDFDLIRPWSDFITSFNSLAVEKVDWDALLLTGTMVLAHAPKPPGIARLLEAQTTVAYLLPRNYVPHVLSCFASCIPQLEALRALTPRVSVTMRFAIDIAWKNLQRRDRWYIFSPAFGRQRPSFSDIEGQEVNYDSITYGI